MVPTAYSGFMVASTQASAALIGLLFVSISIAPQRVFGSEAEASRQGLALSSFTALANVFFISFGSLIPMLPLGIFMIFPGAVAASQTVLLLQLLPNWRRERTLIRGIALFVVSAVLYGYEIAIGVQLWQSPSNTGALTGLLELLLGAYAIGLARAWELLGAAHGRGITFAAFEHLAALLRRPVHKSNESASPPEPGAKPDDRR
jgi:hypothetical protein